MHSQPSLFRKIQSEKQRTKIAFVEKYKIELLSGQPQLGLRYKPSKLRRQWQMSSLI